MCWYVAWIQGGIEFERQEKQRLAEEKAKKEQEEKQLRLMSQNEQEAKTKP